MEQNNKEQRSFELRSQKVQSIVGQIPPALVRHGITVIACVLAALVGVSAFLPYKQVYAGTAVVHGFEAQHTDSVDLLLTITFETNRPQQATNDALMLFGADKVCTGKLLKLDDQRDTLNRQRAVVRFHQQQIKAFQHQTVDCKLVHANGSILQKILANYP